MANMSTRPKWDEAALNAIREQQRLNPYISSTELGALLGVSRNAIIGACNRNGIKLNGNFISGGRSGGPRNPSAPRHAPITNGANAGQKLINRRPLPRPQPLTTEEVMVGGANSYVNAGGGCQWPSGEPGTPEFKFCDDHVVRGSYCAVHAQLALRKPEPRVRRLKSVFAYRR
jgi:GcrA cell cycle regulator